MSAVFDCGTRLFGVTFEDSSLDVEPDSDVADDALHAVGNVVLHELLADLLRLILLGFIN
jgi:hypothetical protein